MAAVPYTEQRHPASIAIDACSPQELAALMLNEDDVFTGWDGSGGIVSEGVLDTIIKVQNEISEILKDCENNAVILAGCGTSGRFAFMTVRTMNDRLAKMNKRPCFEYLMAGYDLALFTSREGFEDSPMIGQEVLKKAARGRGRVLYVGITCGLSAPFVAGQLDLCMQHPDIFTPVLLGFNPVSMARNLPIEGWDKTFLGVARELEEREKEGRAFILNPAVGPELITGSSRMKAGTATKILLDTVFSLAECNEDPVHSTQIECLRKDLRSYRSALYALHQTGNDEAIGEIIKMAAYSLQNGGHLFYLGDVDLGIVGMIDASECPPTYGSAPDDVQGFINGGYESLRNSDGNMSNEFPIDMEFFRTSRLPKTTESDLVIVLAKDGDMSFVPDTRTARCRCVVLNVCTVGDNKILGEDECSHYDRVLQVDVSKCLSEGSMLGSEGWRKSLVEVTAKWFCNTLTTGAHVLIGRVYENLMVDVNVSNSKLFRRAVVIIEKVVGCTEDIASQLLLKSIYLCEDPGSEVSNRPISRHLEVAASRSKVVPLALVLGLGSCTISEANKYLQSFPVIRRAIAELAKKSHESK